jgi:hypothetical protein
MNEGNRPRESGPRSIGLEPKSHNLFGGEIIYGR